MVRQGFTKQRGSNPILYIVRTGEGCTYYHLQAKKYRQFLEVEFNF